MVINVGLVVHHKINLQNSVDLAAYYGAMKQAEMMNAIGHVNYQIRQSYKLLMFRYHAMGSAGDDQFELTKQPNEDPLTKSSVQPAFCINYPPMSGTATEESYCRKTSGQKVELPIPPQVFGGDFGFFNILQFPVQEATQAARDLAIASCRTVGQINWFTLARFIAGYKMDVMTRKKLIIHLARALSDKDNPTDLDNQSIREGIYKTLYKNLTPQNQDSIRAAFGDKGEGNATNQASFEVLNGLSGADCGNEGGEFEPPGWMSEVSIFPYLFIYDAECEKNNKDTNFFRKAITLGSPTSNPQYHDKLDNVLSQIHAFIDEPTGEDPQTRLFKSSLGFEKNPWCMAYMGVKASTTPAIPFSPLGSVKIEARAFAKPFGSQIGPWYGTTWPKGQKYSLGESKETKTDKLVPLRVQKGHIQLDPNNPNNEVNLSPDYSRFIGDTIGQRSNLTLSQGTRAIRSRTEKVQMEWWGHLFEDTTKDTNSGDILAWNASGSTPPSFRELEIQAILPDQFDVSNYAIEPDFYNNYLLRIRKGYGSSIGMAIRGDLGSRMTGPTDELRKFSIKDQLEVAYKNGQNKMDLQSKLTYYVSKIEAFLTSWQGKNPYDYSLDESRFGKCLKELPQNPKPDEYVSGGCISGGRKGYSVKLVDGKYLRESQDMELGGEGVVGSLNNPPPDSF